MLIPLVVVELGTPNNYHLLVQVKINGEEVYLILDTGASHSVIDADFAHMGEVGELSDVAVYGFTTDMVEVQSTCRLDIEMQGGAQFSRVLFIVANMVKFREMYKKITGYNIVGLLGADFLLDRCTAINFKKRTLSITKRRNNA